MAKQLPPFESFAGKMLIAAQNEVGHFFDRSVILITEHTKETGATGYVINQPFYTLSPKEIFKQRNIQHLGSDFMLYRGGPVDLGHGCVLHTDTYRALDTELLLGGLALTETQQVLDDISDKTGPDPFLVLVGKSLWGPGQLEEEIMGNMWILAPLSLDLIFKIPDNKKWQEALATLNIDANRMANNAGRA